MIFKTMGHVEMRKRAVMSMGKEPDWNRQGKRRSVGIKTRAVLFQHGALAMNRHQLSELAEMIVEAAYIRCDGSSISFRLSKSVQPAMRR